MLAGQPRGTHHKPPTCNLTLNPQNGCSVGITSGLSSIPFSKKNNRAGIKLPVASKLF